MQMVGTITRNKVFEILWLYVAKLLKGQKKKKLPMSESENAWRDMGLGPQSMKQKWFKPTS